MNDSTLTKIALFGSIIGIILLFFISSNVEVNYQTVATIDQVPEGEEVQVFGKVSRVTDLENVMFLELQEQKVESVKVILFKDRTLDIKKDDVIALTGSIEEYEGKKEIVASRIEIK